MEPAIGEALSAIEQSRGVLLARMTGSGATCFGLFADAGAAAEAASKIATAHPRWWARPAALAGNAGDLRV